jgi:hypothetical protein
MQVQLLLKQSPSHQRLAFRCVAAHFSEAVIETRPKHPPHCSQQVFDDVAIKKMSKIERRCQAKGFGSTQ